MEFHLKLIGGLLIVLALAHVFFPRYFNWKAELQSLSMINRQIMYVHAFFIGLMVLLMGILCVSNYPDLIETPFGRKVCLGLGLFWACRLAIQWFGYSPKLWRGKSFETVIHIILTIFWIYLSIVFLSIYYVF
ncbi:hypothetical protein ACTJIJ_22800 [Niabella sp. 22666]|uniref:hypothetical protein n=1 Tax=Niabella sp. 22666 TaxID=3453954 RepID=UPI003F839702